MLLLLGTLLTYQSVSRNAFIDFDDNLYVFQNPYVSQGLTASGLGWAFTSFEESNWHPLTWISHMTDVQVFGLKPAGHHLINLWWHCLNVMLLFLLLWRATGALGRSFLVAAIFAVHPLNVETVAWVAERKSLLSLAFGLIAVGSYGYYVKRPNWKRYVAIVIPFALSLMAKPMLVTLPIALLLFDYWPFERFGSAVNPENRSVKFLAAEKIPLFALSIASCVITLVAQQGSVELGVNAASSLGLRWENALCSVALYVAKFFWPAKLSVFYPLDAIRPRQLIIATATLLLISAFVWRQRKRRYLVVGWLFYLLALIPIIGIVQVGRQAMADRYMYVPMIGLLLIVVWGGADLAKQFHAERIALAVAALVLLALSLATKVQVDYWRDTITLFRHAIDVTKNNYVAYNSVAAELALQGHDAEALEYFEESWRENPTFATAAFNIGVHLQNMGQPKRALEMYEQALRVQLPGERELTIATYANLGTVSEQLGNADQAEMNYRRALAMDPDHYGPNLGLGRILCQRAKYVDAIPHLIRAANVRRDATVLFYLGRALEGEGHLPEALTAYQQSLIAKPALAMAQQKEASAHVEALSKNGMTR